MPLRSTAKKNVQDQPTETGMQLYAQYTNVICGRSVLDHPNQQRLKHIYNHALLKMNATD
jgi:hypothetical protein